MTDYQVTWRGFVSEAGGYGRATPAFLSSLERAGVDLRLEPVNFTRWPAYLGRDYRDRLTRLIEKPAVSGKRRILVVHLPADQCDPLALRADHDLILCAPRWESSRAPASWMRVANRYDAFVCFSSRNMQALRESGVTVPIHHVPYGADVETFKPGGARLAIAGLQGTFKFLSAFDWHHRNGPDLLLRAFWAEFGKQDNVALLIQTTREAVPRIRDQLDLRNEVLRCKRLYGYDDGRAPVLVTTDFLAETDLRSLYASADVFVLPTRGEGVGIPFIEAMCCGLPVIATGWGGQRDFLDDNNSWSIDYEMVPATRRGPESVAPSFGTELTSEMFWAEPSIAALREAMRHAASHPDEVRAKGLRARRDMEQMTWSETAAKLKVVFEQVSGRLSCPWENSFPPARGRSDR